MAVRKGAIVCITGIAPGQWSKDDEIAFRDQLSSYEEVRIVTPQIAPILLHGIWLKMLSKGITELVIAMATFGQSGRLKLNGKRYKLPMIGMS